MVQKHEVDGYDKFCEFMSTFDTKGKILYVLFSGSKLPTGQSWCPPCVRAYPVVQEALTNVDPNSHFLYVQVGDKPTWREPRSSFRIDTRTKLMVLPTLIRWQTPRRLEGDQCSNKDLVSLLITDEDED